MTTRIIYFIVSMAVGLFIIVRTYTWVGWVGKSSWAETKIGMGGSYTMWKGIGLLIIAVGFLILIGVVQLSPKSAGSTDTGSQQNNQGQIQQ